MDQDNKKKKWYQINYTGLNGERAKPKEQCGPVEIKETKCTCEACSNVWFYGKEDERERTLNQIHNAGKAMSCCGGCLPSLLIKDKEVKDLNKCQKCGSRAVKKEVITHHV